ncbi:hypothetical protein IWQ56_005366 [Coemansia nantahalensis]|uniref:Uncharacterized protein n=2 Tax=Coemansia TaxID=4863 RepID=A0ACC1LC22_9FUNG|nr:hypothetical protein IWQ56_005366 [Coemansia nantahalensis]KAJ2772154.1 hypothetical protein IWQ57_001888 [Coemansia nantahalensis]KAJ2804913.1 hypothetical protein H4R21_001455 [Coemansia helicoidea]
MPLVVFKTPERVCWEDDASGLTFFVVAKPDTTAAWRTAPATPLADVVNSMDVFRFKRGSKAFTRVASNDELQSAFKTTDKTAVAKSILSAGTINAKEFELEVESQTSTAMNAATSAASVATTAATSAIGGVKGYLASFW